MVSRVAILITLLAAGIFTIGEVIVSFISDSTETGSNSSAAVNELFDSYIRWRMKDIPQFASYAGVHDYDHLLDDMSEEAYEARYNQVVRFLDDAESLLPKLTNDTDIFNTRVLIYELTIFRDGYKYKGFYLPMNYMEGLHVGFKKLLSLMPLKKEKDFENMISRIIAVDKQASQVTALMQRGMDAGIVLSNFSMRRLPEALDAYVVDRAENSFIYKQYFQTFPEDMDDEKKMNIQEKAKSAIINHMVPAFKRVHDFLRDVYKPRNNYSASAHPAGIDYYNQLITVHTSTNLSAAEIHQMGLEEVKRIEGKIANIIRELDYNMTVQEFAKKVMEDPSNHFSFPEELLAELSKMCYTVIPPHLPKIFNTLPKSSLKVQGTDNPSNPFAFYNVGTADGSRPGIVTVEMTSYKRRPKFILLTLALHEAIPGHHLQRSFNIENHNIPLFRRVLDGGNYGIFPSRFPTYTYYSEGWALYAETLGTEMGLFNDTLDRYGHYSFAVFRACRLVVDTGIHALGWTRDQAVEYMFNHTANSREDAENEIDRYITWPGQALAYKMGEFRITALRKEAEKKLGTLFNIKDFHTVVLESYGSMNLVESEVHNWIDRILKKSEILRN